MMAETQPGRAPSISEELLALASRAYALADGRVSAMLRGAEARPADVLRALTARL